VLGCAHRVNPLRPLLRTKATRFIADSGNQRGGGRGPAAPANSPFPRAVRSPTERARNRLPEIAGTRHNSARLITSSGRMWWPPFFHHNSSCDRDPPAPAECGGPSFGMTTKQFVNSYVHSAPLINVDPSGIIRTVPDLSGRYGYTGFLKLPINVVRRWRPLPPWERELKEQVQCLCRCNRRWFIYFRQVNR